MTTQHTTQMPPVEVFAFAAVVTDWACSVDGRFTTLNGDIFCGDPDHERNGLNSGRTFMSDLLLWISEHWRCVERAGDVEQPTLLEPTDEPAFVRPYIYAAGAPAIGVATVPDPDEPAFYDPPQPCPVTGLVDCTERQCELHWSLAPLLLAPDDAAVREQGEGQ